ncbi:MAG TPA: hypothetical protein VGS07_02130 [Thermoanaerobaculia bacterium]|nr:hypothetical protein [Thermoanaerobaculia bacterium]
MLPAVAASVRAQTYDLRGAPKQGSIIQSRTEFKMPEGVLTVESGGTVKRAKATEESASTKEMEVVQTANRQLMMLRLKIAEGWSKSSFEKDGSAPETTIKDDPLVGETLLIERRDDGWQKTLLGHEPNAPQKRRMRELFSGDTKVYPAKPVALGTSWVMEGTKLAALFGFADALSADGKVTYTLKKVIQEAGVRRAVISYRLELKVRSLNDDQAPVDFSIGGSGTIHRSLTTYLDISDHFSGQQQTVGSGTENGHKASFTEAGAIEVNESERLIAAEDRAEVVRRAPVAPETTVAAAPQPRPVENASADSYQPFQSFNQSGCTGIAVDCFQRSGSNCSSGSGCLASGLCTGVPSETCFGKAQFSCGVTPGCFWQSFTRTCSGVLVCAGKGRFACNLTAGCSWLSSCTGTATPCSSLSQKQCEKQPGCSFR